MIQEMSCLDLLGERFAIIAPKRSTKLVKALPEEAAKHASNATRQQNYAEMARDMIQETESDESCRELRRIAAWHYERCAAEFRDSAAGFESAAKIEKAENLRGKLLKKAEAMAEFAKQAELALLKLENSEKK